MLKSKDRNFEFEIATIELGGGVYTMKNFKGEVLLTVREEVYPWLEDYFQGPLKFQLGQVAMLAENLKDVASTEVWK